MPPTTGCTQRRTNRSRESRGVDGEVVASHVETRDRGPGRSPKFKMWDLSEVSQTALSDTI